MKINTMKKTEFERLFGSYRPDETITIEELKNILLTPTEDDQEVETFLDTRVLEYEFPNDTKQHRQLSAMIKNKILEEHKPDVTFRELLETGYYPQRMKLQGQVGKGMIRLLGEIYYINGVEDLWKYKK